MKRITAADLLRRCPFCGGRAHIECDDDHAPPLRVAEGACDRYHGHVICNKCLAEVYVFEDTRENAIALVVCKWNRRTGSLKEEA